MKTFRILAIAAAGVMMMSCAQNECKFNAKEYAERKTEKLDEIVSLDDAQEKAVYAVYLKQGKQIQKEIKSCKKHEGEVKCPDKQHGPKCDKKAECNKPCDKKAECTKKAECNKPCDKKAECTKKAECNKPCDKKAECAKKAECNKPCDKKAECAKKAECNKPHRHPHLNAASREARKAVRQEINALLTPEQQALLKEHYQQRKSCAPKAPKCCPTPNAECANK
ncbi:MAG: hypothetical protein IKA28_01570 [Tidjanibacter sp.]|nr:hypothetical protein [Tidjanibacter sp.]